MKKRERCIMNINKETTLQEMTCNLLSSLNIFYFSIPNEHWNISFAALNALKKRGMIPGIPDLAILHDKKIYFMEFKSEKGKLTKQQSIIIEYLREHGYNVAVVNSLDEVIDVLKILWKIII